MEEDWNWMIFKVTSTQSYSVILWFWEYDSVNTSEFTEYDSVNILWIPTVFCYINRIYSAKAILSFYFVLFCIL